jgi:asparagine synthase (glutamine-hydrolysing)
MCGICGVIQIDGPPREVVDENVLAALTDAMTHRGPDDRATFVEDGVAFGVRRLSVMDPQRGRQPLHSESGDIWAMQNGEIYNHEALRTALRHAGHTLSTRCDTEVLPHLYEEHGDDLTDHLVGMFALAVWDRRRRRAIIARDHVGVKPLYWSRQGDLLVFASELKSLLEFGMPTELDEEAIEAYLTLGFIPGPKTPFKGVQKLAPGHRLVVENGELRVERWWTFPLPEPGVSGCSRDELRDELLDLLTASVDMQLEADVPVGVMLSGGIDSSLIVALAARTSGKRLQTFAVGFEGKNELADARRVADLFGTRHHELLLTSRDIEPALAELAWHLGEPLADLSSVGFYLLSEIASRHVTVALCGQGADELFGGYRKHVAAAYASRMPRFLRPLAGALSRHAPAPFRRPLATLGARGPAERLIAMSGVVDAGILGRGDRPHNAAVAAARAAAAGLHDDPLSAALYLDARLGLVDDMLYYSDRASMAHSLEVRVPFLDHRLVEFSAGLPSSLRVNGRTTKVLLRNAARGLLPDSVIGKPKVGFFNKSVDPWLRDQTSTIIGEALLGQAPRYGTLFNADEVRRAFQDHVSGRDVSRGRILFAVAMLELWLDAYSAVRSRSRHQSALIHA